MEEERRNVTINKQTAISVGLLLALAGIVGSAIWMFATLTTNVARNTERLDRLEFLMERVATKDDLDKLEKNIRDYLIK